MWYLYGSIVTMMFYVYFNRATLNPFSPRFTGPVARDALCVVAWPLYWLSVAFVAFVLVSEWIEDNCQ